jgi:hypothetical protein
MRRSRRPRRFRLTLGHERIAGVILGALVGAWAWINLAPRFFGVHTDGDPFASAAVFTFNSWAIWTTVFIGLGAVGAAFVVAADRQFWNFGLIGAGAGLVFLAAPWLALEKLEMTPEGFSYRTWWGLATDGYAFADLVELRLHHEHRPWSRRGGRTSFHYKTKTGQQGVLCRNTWWNPIYFWASPHLQRMGRVVPQAAP